LPSSRGRGALAHPARLRQLRQQGMRFVDPWRRTPLDSQVRHSVMQVFLKLGGGLHFASSHKTECCLLRVSKDPQPGVAIAGQDDRLSVADEGFHAPEIVARRIQIAAHLTSSQVDVSAGFAALGRKATARMAALEPQPICLPNSQERRPGIAPRPAVQVWPLEPSHIRMSAQPAEDECAAGRVVSGMSGSIRGQSRTGAQPERKSERSKPTRLGG
jgi:hypothetical protein